MEEIKLYMVSDRDACCEVLEELNGKSVNSKTDLEYLDFHYYYYDIENAWNYNDFLSEKGNRILLIRRPGMSCGYFEIDKDDIIVDCKFYDCDGDNSEKEEIMRKHIGKKIIYNQIK